MWFEECDGFAELCRGYLPFYLFIVLPIFILISPANPVAASHEFTAYRMTQYDLNGAPFGSRSAAISLEARSLSGWSTSRHCIIARALSLTPELFRTLHQKAGALIVVLPSDMGNLNENEKEHIISLEQSMIHGRETPISVYFVPSNKKLEAILYDVEHGLVSDDKASSAAEALISSISASGYQVVIAPGQLHVRNDVRVATLHGKLSGVSTGDKIPTIAIVAHYDSAGVAPELSFGAESNASGLAILLELARLFSVLYSIRKSRPQYNMIFVASGAGKVNYQGSKKWLEDQLDGLEGSVIQDVSYVLCLEAMSSSDNLYIHVSKPPKENSVGGMIYKELKSVADSFGHTNISGIHKKINLAEGMVAWEHERYSIRKLPAATLSTFKSYDEPMRSTIVDVLKDEQIDKLYKHTVVIAEALARHLYNTSHNNIFLDPLSVSKDSLTMWMRYLTSQPRAATLLADKQNPFVMSLQEAMQKYLGEVKISYFTPDKRDPEFVFYDITKSTLNVYSVKPAVFDLFLTIAITLYLGLVYLVVFNFSHVYVLATRLSCKTKSV